MNAETLLSNISRKRSRLVTWVIYLQEAKSLNLTHILEHLTNAKKLGWLTLELNTVLSEIISPAPVWLAKNNPLLSRSAGTPFRIQQAAPSLRTSYS